jgi:hypothetical protein
MRAALLFIIAVVLAGGGDNSSSLEGTIFNAASGEPLRKAVVTLRPAGGERGPARSHFATSDNAGHYLISGIEPGAYRLMVERPGFSRQELGARRPGQPGTAIGISQLMFQNARANLEPATGARAPNRISSAAFF